MSGTRDIQDRTVSIITTSNMNANISSSILDLQGTSAYSVQANYTGAPVGTLTLQISNDGVTFSNFPSNTVAISAAGNTLNKYTRQGERFLLVTYAFTSGSGTLNVTAALQG
jgi:hypothetical protein